MCLILIAYRCHPGYELLIAANRDEFHDRPTAPLAFWEDAPQVLAGRDLKEGGTWMGITRNGRFAAITNYRDPTHVLAKAPSRGQLLSDYLQDSLPAETYLEHLQPQAKRYNGFNLLLADANGLYYTSNQINAPQRLTPGWYGLSNHLLNTPWPKVKRGLSLLRSALEHGSEPVVADLFGVLADRVPAPDHELPHTGIPLEWERWLSPLFIDAPGYGTRSSTVLLVNEHRQARMIEKTWLDGSCREFQLDWSIPTRSM